MDVLKLLLENGGDVNQAGNDGCTPVFVASEDGQTAALKLLLENGGDVNQADNESGCTPVHRASSRGQAATLKILLENNGNVNTPNAGDNTSPIWVAGEKTTARCGVCCVMCVYTHFRRKDTMEPHSLPSSPLLSFPFFLYNNLLSPISRLSGWRENRDSPNPPCSRGGH